MTSAVAAVRHNIGRAATLRQSLLRVAVAPDVVALAGLSLLAGLLIVLTWATWGDLGADTGYDLVAGARVAHGQLPYVDFVYYYGPLAPFALGLFALVGGSGIGPAIAFGLLVSFGILGATYALARVFTGPVGAFLAGAIVAPVAFGPTNFSFVLPHTYSATLGMLAVLCSLVAAARYAAGNDRRWLAAAGASAGLVALTRPELEAAMLVAACVWLSLRARAGMGGLGEAKVFAAPALLIPTVVYGAFLTAVSPHRLFLENLFPVAQLHEAGNAIVRVQAPLSAGSFAQLGGRLLLYAAGAGTLLLAARLLSRPRFGRLPLVGAVTAGGAIAALALVARAETLRYGLEFVYGWIPAGALLAAIVLFRRYRRREGAWSPQAQVELFGAVALLAVAARTYAAFFVVSSRPQPAVYAIPLAAVFLVRLHLGELARVRAAAMVGAAWLAFVAAAGIGLTLKDAHAESATVSGPGGALATTPRDAALYRQAMTWIEAGVVPGRPVLIAPQLTALYAISGRTDPLPQIALLPGALHGAKDERAAIARLRSENVRIAILDNRTFPEYGHTSFGGSFDRVLAGWIHRHFIHAATLRAPGSSPHALTVYVRRGK